MINNTSVAVAQVFSIISTVLQIPVLFWHSKQKNVATVCLLAWIVLLNINTFINSIIWGQDKDFMNSWEGQGYCDVFVRIYAGANTGVLCAIIANARGLAILLSERGPTIDPHSFRRRVVDLIICLTVPVLDMAFYTLYSAKRYIIYPNLGCQMYAQQAVPTFIFHVLPPIICAVVAVGYAALALFRYIKKRQDFRDLLYTTNSGLSASRFIRLLVFVSIVVLVMFPITLFFTVTNLQMNFFAHFEWAMQDPDYWKVEKLPIPMSIAMDQWVYICVGFVQFGCFGTGKELAQFYKKCLAWVGVTKLKQSIRQRRRNANPHRFSNATNADSGYELPTVASTSKDSMEKPLTNSPSELSQFSVEYKLAHHTRVRAVESDNEEEDDDFCHIVKGASSS